MATAQDTRASLIRDAAHGPAHNPPSHHLIEIRNATVEFRTKGKTVKAVDDVSLDIDEHDIYGIIGFSGAGKSTLVRTINVLQRLTSGSVAFAGEEISALSERRLKPIRRKIGMIFQHFNLMNSRTVLDNVLFPLKHQRISRRDAERKALDLLRMVGIEEKAHAYPRQLSGGQKQRVAIARALASDPQVLLCDEATSALDPRTTRSILALLKKLNEDLGLTIVLITHEMQVVKDICTKVAVVDRGRVIEKGDILDVFRSPKTALAKEFIYTSGNMSKGIGLAREHPLFAKERAARRLFLLSAVGEGTEETLMADIHRRFGVTGNIMFGSVDVVNDSPVGMILVSLDGADDAVAQALGYFGSVGVKAVPFDELNAEADGAGADAQGPGSGSGGRVALAAGTLPNDGTVSDDEGGNGNE